MEVVKPEPLSDPEADPGPASPNETHLKMECKAEDDIIEERQSIKLQEYDENEDVDDPPILMTKKEESTTKFEFANVSTMKVEVLDAPSLSTDDLMKILPESILKNDKVDLEAVRNMADVSSVSEPCSSINHLNKRKHRTVNIQEWKDVKNKMLRNSGKEYTTRKKIIVCGKKPANDERTCICKHNDCQKITLDGRRHLFSEFYRMNYNNQSKYLSENMEVIEPVHRHVARDISKKSCSFRYFLVVQGRRLLVCQKTFCATFQISRRRVQVLQMKIKDGVTDFKDLRGIHDNRPRKISNDIKNTIRDHILSFPKQPSHYNCYSNSKECLNPDLNVSRMHAMFIEQHPQSLIKLHYYRDIFNTEFKLRFGMPRSYSCSICDKFYIQLISAENESEERRISVNSELHHRRAEKAYEALYQDMSIGKEIPSTIVLCIDLQQVLFCPTLTHSNIFYQRQYATYNFAINDASGNCTMNVWHEIIARRGSTEIVSCLFRYIRENYQPLVAGEDRKLIIWSDRCVGQNNNWQMIVFLQYLVGLNYFREVNQKFLCSGHSFLPCDRNFALIERRKRVCPVYVPEQWKHVIESAHPRKPFVVKEMGKEHFLDFSVLEQSLKKDSDCKITSAMWLQISSDDPTVLRLQKGHNVLEHWSVFGTTKRKRGKDDIYEPPQIIPAEELRPAYSDILPISKEKKADLMAMCDYLEPQYRKFYQSLKV